MRSSLGSIARQSVSLLVALAMVCTPVLQSGMLPAMAAQGAPSALDSAQALEHNHVPGHLLIKFRDNASEAQKATVISENLGTVIDEVPQIHLKVIKVPDFLIDSIEAKLRGNEHIQYVDKDYLYQGQVVPNDPRVSNANQFQIMNAFKAWDSARGDGIKIAILDSGVQLDHPDLVNKLMAGYNFYSNNNNVTDACGHGTPVSGVAAASTDNGIGVASVGWNSQILPLKVTDDSSCFGSGLAIIKAITYAADNGAKVANISFLIYNGSGLVDAAKYMWDKGGLVVASGGNTGIFINQADNPYIISVSETGANDGLVYYDSYGPYIDFAAPCVGFPTTITHSGYGYLSGTSCAAPVMSGIIALMFSANPAATPQQIYDALKKASVDLGDLGHDYHFGWGRPDAYAAVQYILNKNGDLTPPDTLIMSAIDANGNSITTGDAFSNPGISTSNSIAFSFYGRDNTDIAAFQCQSDYGAPWTSCTSPLKLSGLSIGDHNFAVKAIDSSGNVDTTPAGWWWRVIAPTSDVDVPTVFISSPSSGQTLTTNKDYNQDITISGSASDNVALYGVQISLDGAPFRWVSGTGSWTITLTSGVGDGLHTLVARAIDTSANYAYSSSVSFSVNTSSGADTAPPLLTPPPNVIAEATSSSGVTVTYVQPTATDNVGVTNGPTCTPASGSTFPIGTTTVACTATDAAGNTGSASFTVTVRDTTPPTLTVPSNMNIQTTDSSGSTVSFTASAFDLVDGSLTPTCTPSSGFLFPVGTTTVTCNATDAHKNTATASFTVTVTFTATTTVTQPAVSQDQTPPTVSITSPNPDSTIKGQVTISASVSDNVGISKVQLYVNNVLKKTFSSGPFDYSWNTKSIKSGTFTIMIVAYDLNSNTASAIVNVTVANSNK